MTTKRHAHTHARHTHTYSRTHTYTRTRAYTPLYLPRIDSILALLVRQDR